ncbi:hypothetical protein C2I17_13395 [Niallia circulans]|uniref:BglG family transcription antiterminator n=1 Tax=Niallia circulans TaxID=1397 RepID=UPI00201D8221|nr:BglG family transcription antiterminator [Niallia circulans]UQZ75451.1 hypothetical protein C2I17_13395 [Niallia circulans]
MLPIRQQKILHQLMQSKSPLSSDYLANALDVTTRTIRSDMKALIDTLKDNGAEIVLTRGKGYELVIGNYHYFKPFLTKIMNENNVSTPLPTEPEERVDYILKRLLLAEEYLKIEQFAEELFVSESSIKNDLKEVRRLLKDFNLNLDKKPNYGLKIMGQEAKLRYCLAAYVFDQEETDWILPNKKLEEIRKIIIEQAEKASIFLSDIGVNNLATHIAIACIRIQNDNYVAMPLKEMEPLKEKREFAIAKQIVFFLEKTLYVTFPESEIAYITIHLLGAKMVVYQSDSRENMLEMIEEDILALTKAMLQEVEQELDLEIAYDEELIYGLCLHLKPAINRYKYDLTIKNPLLAEIKKNYQMSFDAAVIMGKYLSKHKRMDINEDEIGYLALHIGAALERKKAKGSVKRCLIVCATGVASAQLLYHKLQSTFGNKLEIVGTANMFTIDNYDLSTLDFIVSTIPINRELTIPVIDVHTILREEDISKLEHMVVDRVETTLQYFYPDLGFFQQEYQTKEEVLAFLAREIIQKGIAPDHFFELIMEREEIAPTSYGNSIAIPHPLKPITDSTFLSICTLKKPIQWGENKVQLIFLLSVQKKYKKDIQKLYQLLVKISGNAYMVNQLLKVKSFDEFKECILAIGQ